MSVFYNLSLAVILVCFFIIIWFVLYYFETSFFQPKFHKLPKATIKYRRTSDPQNVHDSSVIKSIENKYKRLRELAKDEFLDLNIDNETIEDNKEELTILQIKNYAKNLSPEDRDKLDCFLESLNKNNKIYALDDSDRHILSMVWARIHSKDNYENLENLKEALIKQILDGVEYRFGKNHTVCLNGKVSRIISSLTILDSDVVLSKPELGLSEIEHLAYLKASSILHENLNAMGMTEIYSTPDDNLTSEEKSKLDKFIEICKNNIESAITTEYSDLLRPHDIKNIIQKAQQGV